MSSLLYACHDYIELLGAPDYIDTVIELIPKGSETGMSMQTTVWVTRTERQLIDEFLAWSGAHRTDALTVTGVGAGRFLVELCHRGFTKVCATTCARGSVEEPADTVWVPHAERRTLAQLLPMITHRLRPGGTLLIHGEGELTHPELRSIRHAFMAAGFPATVQAIGRTGYRLFARKRQAGPVLKFAA
jgi:hypothetical protein